MSEKTYAVLSGIIQFDPREREVNGKTVKDVTIKTFGTQKLVSVTIWPEIEVGELKVGDTIFVDGQYSTSLGQAKDGTPREYTNVSAQQVGVVPAVAKAAREVVQRAAATTSNDEPLF